MYIIFDGRLVNTDALSELISVVQNGEYKIMALRLDGSYMTSESFSDATKATERFSQLTNLLIKEK